MGQQLRKKYRFRRTRPILLYWGWHFIRTGHFVSYSTTGPTFYNISEELLYVETDNFNNNYRKLLEKSAFSAHIFHIKLFIKTAGASRKKSISTCKGN